MYFNYKFEINAGGRLWNYNIRASNWGEATSEAVRNWKYDYLDKFKNTLPIRSPSFEPLPLFDDLKEITIKINKLDY